VLVRVRGIDTWQLTLDLAYGGQAEKPRESPLEAAEEDANTD